MAATLQSILGNGVILPGDLLPDDTTVIYDANGNPICEKDYNDPYDEGAQDQRDFDRYVALALSYYNSRHQTDYKFVDVKGGDSSFDLHSRKKSVSIKCYFNAAPSSAVKCRCAAEQFLAKLHAELCYDSDSSEESVTSSHDGSDSSEEFAPPCHDFPFTSRRNASKKFVTSRRNESVTSCRIVDGPKKTACKLCDISACEDSMNCDTSGGDKEAERKKSKEDKYSQYLADGVSLSDKAKVRVEFPLLALAYYNKKQHTDYKLVDALPYCIALENAIVAHCNFVARKNAPADAPNKLFFAELEKPDTRFVVIACRVLRGKSTAGCHYCPRRRGKRVIHPTRGFRYGLYPEINRPLRRRRH